MICFYCNKSTNSFKAYFTHLHEHTNISEFRCTFNDCDRRFSLFSSFKNHVYSHNNFETVELNTIIRTPELNVNIELINIENESVSTINLNEDTIDIDEFIKAGQFELLKIIVSVLNQNSVARSHGRLILKKAITFFQNQLNFIRTNILQDVDNNKFTSIIDWLCDPNLLKSEYKIILALTSINYYIAPETHSINKQLEPIMRNSELLMIEKNTTIKIMPLSSMLRELFNKTNILQNIIDYISKINQLDSKFIYNFIQSKWWEHKLKEHNNLEPSTLILPIIVYFDDFETNNGLGSRSGIKKVGGIYIKIPCLPEYLNSRLSQIYAAMLFHTNDRKYKNFGNSRMLAPLTNELDKLSTIGIEVNHVKYKKVKFITVLVTGDNLGINSILGFTESFSSTYYCRFCKTPKKDCWTQCKSSTTNLRNIQNYNDDIALDNSKLTGIIEFSIFNDITDFHVTQNHAPDIMHDILEGVMHYDLLALFKKCIKSYQYFTVEELNARMKSFDFGPKKGVNRPQPLVEKFYEKFKFKYSASEMVTFFRNMGAIIGDKIPVGSKEWQLFIKLRQIWSILCQDVCHKDDHILLDGLVWEHNEIYIKVFNTHLKPKFHFMTHYGYLMQKIGPLKMCWAMRFEGKHREFKQCMNVSTCRKNILQTMAVKHQLKFSNLLFEFNDTAPNKKFGISRNIPNLNNFLKRFNFDPKIETVVKVYTWIDYYNFYLKANMIFTYDSYEDDVPVFGLIKYIVQCGEEISVLFEQIENNEFNEHYFGFFVTNTHICANILINDIKVQKTSHINILKNGQEFVSWD